MSTNEAQAFEVPCLATELAGLVAQIPRGSVTTYGDLAQALGDRAAARWVGQFLQQQHHHHGDCVCHRVVRADGQLGRHQAGTEGDKRQQLEREGITWQASRVRMDRHRVRHFQSTRPLVALRAEQTVCADRVSLAPLAQLPAVVGGMDVSYASREQAVAAFTLVDVPTAKLVWSTTVCCKVRFPYIPTYLAFRELPVLLKLVDTVRQAGRLPAVTLVDGAGVLHPRRLGIASMLGVLADMPTIGVAKKRLFGTIDNAQALLPGQSRPVLDQGVQWGTALLSTRKTRKPIYISPGHQIDVPQADRLVCRLIAGHRLPEPLFEADRISRQAARRLAADGIET